MTLAAPPIACALLLLVARRQRSRQAGCAPLASGGAVGAHAGRDRAAGAMRSIAPY